MSEINVTPFVDVLLVLLIVFMIAAPMMTGSVNVDLPKGSSEAIQEKTQPVIVTIDATGKIFLQDQFSEIKHLNSKLLQITNNNSKHKIYIKADKNIDYGKVMSIIKHINQGGFSKVILVTDLT